LTATRTQKITQTKKTHLKHNAQKELSFTATSVGHEQLEQKQAHAKQNSSWQHADGKVLPTPTSYNQTTTRTFLHRSCWFATTTTTSLTPKHNPKQKTNPKHKALRKLRSNSNNF
jgi:hypothetical protein